MTIDEQIKAYKTLRENGQAFFVDNYEDADRIIEALEKQIEYKDVRRKIENINPVDFGSIFSYESHNGARDMKKAITEILDDWSEVE